MARPSRYTAKLGETICKRIASGESLRAICRDKDMPHRDTVRQWLASGATMHSGFLAQYARARDEQADHYAAEILEIADTARPENASVAKLRIDARKWYAGKVRPKKWGTERVEHAGDKDAPLTLTIERVTSEFKAPDA